MIQESFYNGVVIGTRDEATLEEGELTRADETVYYPARMAPEPALGRTALLDAPEENTLGIRWISRETEASDVVFTYQTDGVTSSYRFIAVDGEDPDPGSTTEIDIDAGLGTVFDAVQLGPYVVLINGSQSGDESNNIGGIIVELDVAPTTVAPLKFIRPTRELSAVPGIGSWTLEEGTYTYWYTEYMATLDIESPAQHENAQGAVFMPNGLVTVSKPTGQTNSRATHWRIYRGGPDDTGISPFPVGILVAELPLSTLTYDDDGSTDLGVFRFLTLSVDGAATVNFEQMGETLLNPTTIDVFENSVVVNREPGSTVMHYSFPDSPSSWPDPYFINFESAQGDAIVRLIAIADALIVLMNNQVVSVSRLPRETDAEFIRGRAYKVISSSHGVAGRNAATLFTPDGAQPAVAFMSPGGQLYVTDGFRVEALETDIDWTQLIDDFSSVILRDFSELKVLAVYYTPKAADDGF